VSDRPSQKPSPASSPASPSTSSPAARSSARLRAASRGPTSPSPVLFVDDARFDAHAPLGHHPERPERLAAARAGVKKAGVPLEPVPARPATDDELARVHDPRFIEALSRLRGDTGYLDPDTYVSAQSVDVARLAAGSLVQMVDAMIDGPARQGVALLRPPGHHARPARAMGFCLLNNVAVAAAHARARGVDRVAIVDWDVHHGNGTQEMFWRDPHVLYLSTHQFPFYPGTGDVDEVGEGEGTGFTVNVPLAAHAPDAVYAQAFDRVILPVLEAYAPELVLVSAGFDAAARDPLAQMELSPEAFGWMARELARIAASTAHGRIGLVLEGGYDLVALEGGVRSAVQGMASGVAVDIDRVPSEGASSSGPPSRSVTESLERAVRGAARSWAVVE
jgi:acetoin utilization deacetylase AcuC-like enzyme